MIARFYVWSVAVLSLALERSAAGRSAGNFTCIAARDGYHSEEHAVTTDDGYVLTIFRIRRGAGCRARAAPVVIMHGLLMSSDSWLDAGRQAALPYLLSDACYDTWVGNTRGNTYARRHMLMDPDVDEMFWEFSFDESASYDVPAIIDYVLHRTGALRLNYLGYSQGGSMILSAISERPEYSHKLGVIIAAAPPTHLRHMTSPVRWLFVVSSWLEKVLNKIGLYEVLSKDSLLQNLGEYFCRFPLFRDSLCRGLLYVMDSPHPGSIADETCGALFAHFPAGTSVRSLARFGQVARLGKFQKYDFGEVTNLRKYGSVRPPLYDLSSVKVPTVLIQGVSDTFVTVQDSEWTARRLPNLQELYIVEDPLWNHLDVIYSSNISISIFPKINQYMLKYNE